MDANADRAMAKWNMRYGHEAASHVVFDWKHLNVATFDVVT
ncbi:MAG: hypothetical protein ABI552_08115 [Casimicrobiaceae bacterium]